MLDIHIVNKTKERNKMNRQWARKELGEYNAILRFNKVL